MQREKVTLKVDQVTSITGLSTKYKSVKASFISKVLKEALVKVS